MTASSDASKYGVVISAECGSFRSHEPHVIKEGFLGFGRVSCKGYIHRHFWQLDPIRPYFAGKAIGRPFFIFTVNWKCHCGEFQHVSKPGFYREMVGL